MTASDDPFIPVNATPNTLEMQELIPANSQGNTFSLDQLPTHLNSPINDLFGHVLNGPQLFGGRTPEDTVPSSEIHCHRFMDPGSALLLPIESSNAGGEDGPLPKPRFAHQ